MYVGEFSIGGCLLLTGQTVFPDWSDLWIRLWITFDKVLEGALPPWHPFPDNSQD
jgi:hypothetical protein